MTNDDDMRAGVLPRCLCLTSSTMLLPWWLQRACGLATWQASFMSGWCALTWAVSLLYWHRPRAGWRLDLDNAFAKADTIPARP